MPSSWGESLVDSKSPPPEQASEISLWERLGKAVALDIELSSFSWDMLSSLHHTEHSSSNENSEDEMSKALEITDEEDSNINCIFEEASDFIDNVESVGGRVLVHCFEGRSRSATLVLAYLMLRKKLTLLEAWNALRQVHRLAQPNDGFARILLNLDLQLHRKVSMEWQRRKPEMIVCPICGKNAGLNSSSLKLHLQKSHKKLSSGSVGSAMTMEIQKALDALKMTRGGSDSPTLRQSSVGLGNSFRCKNIKPRTLVARDESTESQLSNKIYSVKRLNRIRPYK